MACWAAPNSSVTGCGSPTFAPTAGAISISFTGGNVAAGSTCTVEVDVTAPTEGTHTNTSGLVHIITLRLSPAISTPTPWMCGWFTRPSPF